MRCHNSWQSVSCVAGIEATRKTVAAIHLVSCEALTQLGRPAELLRSIADFTLKRQA